MVNELVARLCHGARLPIRAAKHFHPSETGFSINQYRKQWGGRAVPANGRLRTGWTHVLGHCHDCRGVWQAVPSRLMFAWARRGPQLGNSTEQNRKPHFWSSGSERQVKSIRPTAHQLELSALEERPAGQGRPLRGQHLNKRLQEGGRAAWTAGGRTLWREGRTDSRPLTSGMG